MRKIDLAFIVLAFGLFPPAARCGDLHVIIAADTTDKDIGNGVIVDVNRVLGEMDKVAQYSSLKLRKQVIDGNQLTLPAVQSAVQSVSPNRDDVVLFYYSGHGFRTPSQNGPWPSLSLRNRTGIDEYDVFYTLHKKRPRLLLVICDCCNSVIPDGVVNVGRAKPDLTSQRTRNAYRNLFEISSGSIIASSSKPGEYSVGNERDGGLFTLAFVNSLQTWISNDEATWNAIFRGACRTIPLGADQSQTPQHQIYAVLQQPAGDSGTSPSPGSTTPPSLVPSTVSSNSNAKPRPLAIVMNGDNSRAYIKEVTSGADSGALVLNGDHENVEVFARRDQSLLITINGDRNRLYMPRSLSANARISTNGFKNEIIDTSQGQAGVTTTAPGPPSSTPGNGLPISLKINVSGVGNGVYLQESANDPHSGNFNVSGVGGGASFRLAPNTRATISISGTGNAVTMHKSLKNRVTVKTSGIGNEVVFK